MHVRHLKVFVFAAPDTFGRSLAFAPSFALADVTNSHGIATIKLSLV